MIRASSRPIGCATVVVWALLLAAPAVTQAQAAQNPPPAPRLVPGRNVNMAGGSQILDVDPQTFQVRGDVLGRAQNEPSCAISTRNPQHVLCGANDYRMVDVPGVSTTQIIRDAWLGEFQSADGGDTWESTLAGGFFLDPAPHPLRTMGFTAAADPVVRSGPGGLAFYAGIAFTADKSRSALHLTTYADLNNRELDTMPFKRVRTVIADTASGVRFIDKPWIYVEAAAGGQTCSIDVQTTDPTSSSLARTLLGKKVTKWLQATAPGWTGKTNTSQRVPASVIHVVYTVFLDADDKTAEIRYTRSDNCGGSFSRPVRLNDVDVTVTGDDHHGNGAAIAKPFVNGSRRVVVTWRRVKPKGPGTNPTAPADAMMGVVSENNGRTFTPPFVIDEICPFDQGTSSNTFRTTTFPTMAADANGRFYMAWADRREANGVCTLHPSQGTPEGAARIRVATSPDGRVWTSTVAVPSSAPEHQIMPSLAFTAGRLFLAWIDFGEDVSQQFGQYVDEAKAYEARSFRHTGDVRASMALPGPAPAFDEATKVSEYLRGVATVNGERRELQLQWNAVNRRWARKGTVPFNGDYIDIATRPYLPPDPLSKDKSWQPNNALTLQTPLGPVPMAPNLIIAWGDNRDMRIGPGVDTVGQPVPYKTPAGLDLPTNSVYVTGAYGQTAVRPVCTALPEAYQTGTMNQNAYAARASIGFLAAAPGGNKALGTLQRSFVVFIRNDELVQKTFRLATTPPQGAYASFDQFVTTRTTIDAIVPARSSVARTVYVGAQSSSLDPLSAVRVDVIEMAGGAAVQATTLLLNADASAPEIESPEIESREIFAPEIESPEIESRTLASPEIESPEIESPEIESPEIESATWLALGLQFPEIESPEIESPEIESPEIESPEIESPEIESVAITDARFEVTNSGNTAGQYNAKAFINGMPSNATYQLIVRRRYEIPAVNALCEPTTITISKVIVNLPNVQLGTPEIESPEIESSAPGTATFYIAPAETVDVIVRARYAAALKDTITPAQFELAAAPEAVDSLDAEAGFTKPEAVTTYLTVRTTTLAPGMTGVPYTAQLEASGNDGATTWSAPNPALLPPGLTLAASGQIFGTPTTAGSFTFGVQVADSALQAATTMLTIIVTQSGQPTLAFVAEPSDAYVGEAITPPVSVRAFDANGAPAAGVSVTLVRQDAGPLGGGANGLTRVTNATGVAVFDTLSVPAEATGIRLMSSAPGYAGSTSAAFNVGNVTALPDLVVEAITHSPDPVETGGSVTVSARVKNVGTAPANGSLLMLQLAGETSGTPATLFTVPPLAPGASYTKVRTTAYSTTGNRMTNATVDYTGAVPESSEGNNSLSASFSVTTAGTISGTVTAQSSGGPLSGATVLIFDSLGNTAATLTSATNGTYTSPGLPSGVYYAHIRPTPATGWLGELYNQLPCWPSCAATVGHPIVVTAGANTSGIDFSLEPAGRISGRVTSAATSNPVSAATVQILSAMPNDLTNLPGFEVASVTTDPNGNYVSPAFLRPGPYYVRVTPRDAHRVQYYNDVTCENCARDPGQIPPGAQTVQIGAGGTVTGIDFALDPGGFINGTVTDAASGATVNGAPVAVLDEHGATVWTGATTASGTYQSPGLRDGLYFVRAGGQTGTIRYLDEVHNNRPCAIGCSNITGDPVAIAGVTVVTVNFALERGGRITGTVVDGNGAPLGSAAGTQVIVFTLDGVQVLATGANASGAFVAAPLPTGSYIVRATARGHVTRVYNGQNCPANTSVVLCSPTTVSVTAGADTTGINLTLPRGSRLHGRVTDAFNSPLTSHSQLFAAVSVFNAQGVRIFDASLDADGHFHTTAGFPAGTYYLRTSNSSGLLDEANGNVPCAIASCDVTASTPVVLDGSTDATALDFALDAGGMIHATVVDEPAGNPVPGTFVHIHNASGALVWTTAVFRNTGVATSTGLPAGNYYVRTRELNYGKLDELHNGVDCATGCNVSTGTPVPVTTGGTTFIGFNLAQGGRIRGWVSDSATGWAVTGATVAIYKDGVLAATTTTILGGSYVKGMFLSPGLPPGDYTVRVTAPGYALPTTETPVTITGTNEAGGVNIALTPD